jgi:hypothetical protein
MSRPVTPNAPVKAAPIQGSAVSMAPKFDSSIGGNGPMSNDLQPPRPVSPQPSGNLLTGLGAPPVPSIQNEQPIQSGSLGSFGMPPQIATPTPPENMFQPPQGGFMGMLGAPQQMNPNVQNPNEDNMRKVLGGGLWG